MVTYIFILIILITILLIYKINFSIKKSNDSSGFIILNDFLKEAVFEMRYCSSYNFVGKKINGYEEPLAIITKEAAKALKEVNDELQKEGLCLKIYDAYRPVTAVNHFINWSKDMNDTSMKNEFYPEIDKKALIKKGYIKERSSHSRGSTVDLTLYNLNTKEDVDMGSPFDYFGELSHFNSKLVNKEQHENRMMLRNIMIKHGFKPLENEWWHFTLKNEPYPHTYFDFKINKNIL